MAGSPWQLKTQTAAYWQESLAITAVDLEALYMFILESARPQDSSSLALQLVKRYCREEQEAIEGELRQHPVFQPESAYKSGQVLTFPSEGYTLGTIKSLRPGNNPSYGEFVVMEVAFEGDSRVKYFASGLGERAPLGLPQPPDLGHLVPPEALFELYGPKWVVPRLAEALGKNDDFVHFQDLWFLKELLAEVHVGHINICEALVDVNGRALSAEEMLGELELPSTLSKAARVFSLDYALAHSDIFVNVAEAGQPLWNLARLQSPPQATQEKR